MCIIVLIHMNTLNFKSAASTSIRARANQDAANCADQSTRPGFADDKAADHINVVLAYWITES